MLPPLRRGENQTAAKQYLCKDLFDLTAADLRGFDAFRVRYGFGL